MGRTVSVGRHPRKHESAPRAAQLERLKEQRRSAPKGHPETRPRARRPILHQGDFVAIGHAQASEPSYGQLLAEIQRVAMGGVMPSPAVFDHARPATWPTADELCGQLGTSWSALAAEAGLKVLNFGRGNHFSKKESKEHEQQSK